MTGRQRRFVLWSSLGALLLIGLLVAFRPKPIAVDYILAARGPMSVSILEEGKTQVHDVFLLSSPVTGRALRVEAHVGDPVVAGETVLVQIEPIDPTLLDVRSETEARAAVQIAIAARQLAESEYDRANAELDFTRSELGRQKNLADRGATSERDLDSARHAFRIARAAREKARAAIQERSFELDRARARLVSPKGPTNDASDCECIDLRAPVSGVVLRIHHESAGVVNAGQPLLEIGDPENLEIVVDLLSADAVQVEPGLPVRVEEWGGSKALRGQVRRVEPYGFTKVSALGIEEQRVRALIDLLEAKEAWSRLGHGYRVEARIVLWKNANVLRLPLAALFRDDEAWSTFVDIEGRANLRHVEIGHQNQIEVEILDGIVEGERVILYPSEQIVEGSRLTKRR
jgi:HlyD family secretion protein